MDARGAVPPRALLDVRVTGGVVRGVAERGIHAWRGIPYAAPPLGRLRFRAPKAVVPWHGVRDASAFGDVAPQLYKGQFRGVGPLTPASEDCLSINVLAAADVLIPHRGLPVMVYIHGGGYSVGSSQDFTGQGNSFVRSRRVVYVSFNYRLGAFGYLHFTRYSSRKRPIDGNLGLRDQVAALRWVRTNIRAFGGDPHNVTVFGQSAGGNAVTTLMATPSARGLFSRAIAQSPPPNAVYTQERADKWAGDFIPALRGVMLHDGQPLPDAASPVNVLLAATALQLNNASLILQLSSPDADPGTFCLAPVIDGNVIPERPLDAFRNGRAHRVPLIIGTNEREGSIFRGRVDILPRSPARIRTIFERAPRSSRTRMHDAYPGLPGGHAATDFGGDYAFWYPSVVVADRHALVAPVHVYRFDVAPRLLHALGIDATHGIELFTLFGETDGTLARTMSALGGRDAYIGAGERMRTYWLDFVCTGTFAESWPAYTADARRTLILDEKDRVERDPQRARRLAWTSFLPDM
ncbi:MAG TPA: carboxylesterase/lipase family protein [Microbacteriaceae bacterium]